MNVIWHHDKCINLNARIKYRQIVSNALYHLSCIVQPHFAIHHLAKQIYPILRAYSDEIGARLSVIISFESDAAPVVAFESKPHGIAFLQIALGASLHSRENLLPSHDELVLTRMEREGDRAAQSAP